MPSLLCVIIVTPGGYDFFLLVYSKISPFWGSEKWGAWKNEMPSGLRSYYLFVQCLVESYQHIYHSQRTWSLVLSKFPVSYNLNGFMSALSARWKDLQVVFLPVLSRCRSSNFPWGSLRSTCSPNQQTPSNFQKGSCTEGRGRVFLSSTGWTLRASSVLLSLQLSSSHVGCSYFTAYIEHGLI